MPRPRRSRDDWRQHIDAWRRSGCSGDAYAVRHGLNPRTFAWWRSALRSDPPPARPLTLVPVQLPPVATSYAVVEVALPNGMVLRVPEHADPGRIAALLHALADRC